VFYKWYALSKETRRVYGSAVKAYEGYCGRMMVASPWYLAKIEVVHI
jgi:hypothetical protein